MEKWEIATRLLGLSKLKITAVMLLLAVVSLTFAASFSVQTESVLRNEKIADRSPKTDREDVVLKYDLEDYTLSIGTNGAVQKGDIWINNEIVDNQLYLCV